LFFIAKQTANCIWLKSSFFEFLLLFYCFWPWFEALSGNNPQVYRGNFDKIVPKIGQIFKFAVNLRRFFPFPASDRRLLTSQPNWGAMFVWSRGRPHYCIN
jgi:hypothetical protein